MATGFDNVDIAQSLKNGGERKIKGRMWEQMPPNLMFPGIRGVAILVFLWGDCGICNMA